MNCQNTFMVRVHPRLNKRAAPCSALSQTHQRRWARTGDPFPAACPDGVRTQGHASGRIRAQGGFSLSSARRVTQRLASRRLARPRASRGKERRFPNTGGALIRSAPLWVRTAAIFKHKVNGAGAEHFKETTTGVLRREEMSDQGEGAEPEALAKDGTLPGRDNITNPEVTCVLQRVPVLTGAPRNGHVGQSTAMALSWKRRKGDLFFPCLNDSVTKNNFDNVSGDRHFLNNGMVRHNGLDDWR